MKLINLTPHTVCLIYKSDDNLESAIVYRSSGVARCKQADLPHEPVVIERADMIGCETKSLHFPLVSSHYGDVEGLPPQSEGVGYIVSQIVSNALPQRTDLFFPAALVRDDAGNIRGCAALGRGGF